MAALVTWAAISDPYRWPAEVVAEWKEQGYVDVHNSRTGETIPLSTAVLHEVERLGESTLNIAAAASAVRSPWLVIHGSRDETVPLSEGERLHDSSKGVSVFRLVEGAGHAFDASHPLAEASPVLDEVTRETVQFFARYLASPRM